MNQSLILQAGPNVAVEETEWLGLQRDLFTALSSHALRYLEGQEDPYQQGQWAAEARALSALILGAARLHGIDQARQKQNEKTQDNGLIPIEELRQTLERRLDRLRAEEDRAQTTDKDGSR